MITKLLIYFVSLLKFLFIPKKDSVPDNVEYRGYYIKPIYWKDSDLIEYIIVYFYENTTNGKRTTAIDYNGTLVRTYEMGKNLYHICRVWKDAGIRPEGTVIDGSPEEDMLVYQATKRNYNSNTSKNFKQKNNVVSLAFENKEKIKETIGEASYYATKNKTHKKPPSEEDKKSD